MTARRNFKNMKTINTIVFLFDIVCFTSTVVNSKPIHGKLVFFCTYILHKDSPRDGWIKEFVKRIWSSGLFWAVGAAEKTNSPTAISKQLFEVVFSTFCGQNFFFNFSKNIFASALKSYVLNIKLNSVRLKKMQNSIKLFF